MVKNFLFASKSYAVLLVIACVFFGSVFKVSASSRELMIMAGFLYNFSKYVQWPAEKFANDKSPMIFCIINKDSFVSIVEETLKGKTTQGRRLITQSRKRSDDLKSCHLVFMGFREQESVGHVWKFLPGSGVLTVGRWGKTSNAKVIINLIKDKNKFKFAINTNAADQANLKIGSKLLKLAVQ